MIDRNKCFYSLNDKAAETLKFIEQEEASLKTIRQTIVENLTNTTKSKIEKLKDDNEYRYTSRLISLYNARLDDILTLMNMIGFSSDYNLIKESIKGQEEVIKMQKLHLSEIEAYKNSLNGDQFNDANLLFEGSKQSTLNVIASIEEHIQFLKSLDESSLNSN